MISRTRLVQGTILAFMAVIALATPATAGTAEDPELTDACGEQPPGMEWADICSAWVQAVLAPPTGSSQIPELVELNLGFEMAGGMAARPLTAVHNFGWMWEICLQSLRLAYVADRSSWQAEVVTYCEGDLLQAVPLPLDTVTVTATGVRISLGKAELRQIFARPSYGSRLDLWASTAIGARVTGVADYRACCSDSAYAQRPYIVGYEEPSGGGH